MEIKHNKNKEINLVFGGRKSLIIQEVGGKYFATTVNERYDYEISEFKIISVNTQEASFNRSNNKKYEQNYLDQKGGAQS